VAPADSRDLVRHADGLVTNVNTQVGPPGSDARATPVRSGRARQVPALVEDVRRVVAKVDAHADPCSRRCKRLRRSRRDAGSRASPPDRRDGALNQDSPLATSCSDCARSGAVTVAGSLADYLERNPDAVVYGVRRPVVKEGR
jgi:hypothetical protein